MKSQERIEGAKLLSFCAAWMFYFLTQTKLRFIMQFPDYTRLLCFQHLLFTSPQFILIYSSVVNCLKPNVSYKTIANLLKVVGLITFIISVCITLQRKIFVSQCLTRKQMTCYTTGSEEEILQRGHAGLEAEKRLPRKSGTSLVHWYAKLLDRITKSLPHFNQQVRRRTQS